MSERAPTVDNGCSMKLETDGVISLEFEHVFHSFSCAHAKNDGLIISFSIALINTLFSASG